MPEFVLFLVSGAVFAYALISQALDRHWLTPTLTFLVLGVVLGPSVTGVIDFHAGGGGIEILAETTLMLILFTDAARIDVSVLRREFKLPLRMLLLGIPLALLIGTGLAVAFFPSWSLWSLMLLAALLIPTDAAVGQPVVEEKSVPLNLRQSLNVESGLNDGLALPLVLFLASSAAQASSNGGMEWLTILGLQVTLGPLVGIGVGWLGERAFCLALHRDFIRPHFERLAILALPVISYGASEMIGGNGFLSAFVAGLVFGHQHRKGDTQITRFAHLESQLLVLLTFLLLGSIFVGEALAAATWVHWVYAMMALFVMRPAAIALSLAGSGLRWISYGFLGWFGPRGTASLIFLILVTHRYQIREGGEIFTIVVLTILLSTVLHGMSALPVAKYVGRVLNERCQEGDPEMDPVTRHDLR